MALRSFHHQECKKTHQRIESFVFICVAFRHTCFLQNVTLYGKERKPTNWFCDDYWLWCAQMQIVRRMSLKKSSLIHKKEIAHEHAVLHKHIPEWCCLIKNNYLISVWCCNRICKFAHGKILKQVHNSEIIPSWKPGSVRVYQKCFIHASKFLTNDKTQEHLSWRYKNRNYPFFWPSEMIWKNWKMWGICCACTKDKKMSARNASNLHTGLLA